MRGCSCVSLTCASCRVLQEVQQDEARAETEAAPRPLPVGDVLQDDVAALFFFVLMFLQNTTRPVFRTTNTDCVFDILTFRCLFLFPF